MPKAIASFLNKFHVCANPVCDNTFEVAPTGRKRKYCSESCRNRDWKHTSNTAILRAYDRLSSEFFSLRSHSERQSKLEQWATSYAYWCNGEYPDFYSEKEALLTKYITRPKTENESGKNIHDRIISYLRTKGIEDQKIYDRVAVVQAFGLTPNPELSKETEASSEQTTPMPSSIIPTKAKAVIAAPVVNKTTVNAKPDIDEEVARFFDDAFSELDDDELIIAKPKPVVRSLIENNIIVSLSLLANSKDRSDVNLERIIGQLVSNENEFELHVARLQAMIDNGEVEFFKDESGMGYHRMANAVPTQYDNECVFYHSGLKYLNERNGNKDNSKTLNYHFHSKFGHYASNEVKNSRPFKLDNGEAAEFIKQKLAEYAKSRQAA